MGEAAKQGLYELVLKAQNAEEAVAIAEDAGIELAEGEAEALFERLSRDDDEEVADEELDNVAGGGCKPTRTVRPGVDMCGHASRTCFDSCRYYKPHEGEPGAGECYNGDYLPV